MTAAGRSRTCTGKTQQRPERCASANSATAASNEKHYNYNYTDNLKLIKTNFKLPPWETDNSAIAMQKQVLRAN